MIDVPRGYRSKLVYRSSLAKRPIFTGSQRIDFRFYENKDFQGGLVKYAGIYWEVINEVGSMLTVRALDDTDMRTRSLPDCKGTTRRYCRYMDKKSAKRYGMYRID